MTTENPLFQRCISYSEFFSVFPALPCNFLSKMVDFPTCHVRFSGVLCQVIPTHLPSDDLINPSQKNCQGFWMGWFYLKKTRYRKNIQIFILTDAHIYIYIYYMFFPISGVAKKQNTSHQQLIMIWRFMFPPIMGPH